MGGVWVDWFGCGFYGPKLLGPLTPQPSLLILTVRLDKPIYANEFETVEGNSVQ